ncbi:deoxyribose-phosphate aldolase [Clostridiales bacterium PH28_bin88]|nr:deoxyribose-phosphate aldolase [Clostridiales bacterium PH28_bin88]
MPGLKSLKPEASKADILNLCTEAARWKFKAVCVNPVFTDLAAKQLSGTDVQVCTVVGFPSGATTTEAKVFETQEAINNGANEIDMVINIGALKAGDYSYISNEIKNVVKASNGALVKVIIETCLLTDQEKRTACELAAEAGAHFVKTSTGFGNSGATIEDVALMKKVVGEKLGVKASGGIKDKETIKAMVAAGATRIGTSSGVKIMETW